MVYVGVLFASMCGEAGTQDLHAKGASKLCYTAPDMAQADDAQDGVRQFALTQVGSIRLARPAMLVLQAHHLRPGAVEDQHTPDNVFADLRFVNAGGRGYNNAATWLKDLQRTQSFEARARILQPAQFWCALKQVVGQVERAENFSALQSAQKLFPIG